jgi:CHAT domain-containing protein/tetratricopeptide (TPR) repeat protein
MRFPKRISGFVIGMLLLTCLVCFDRPLGVSSLSQSNDADAIRGLVQKIFESYQQKELDKLVSLWNEKSPFLTGNKKTLQGEFSAYEKIAVKGFDIRQTKIDGDKTTLRVVAEMALTRTHMVNLTEKLAKKNKTIELAKEGGIWKVWKFIASEEVLAAAIIVAKTEEEWKALMEKEPELITSDLVDALIRHNNDVMAASQRGYQHALAINRIASKLAEQLGDQLAIANAAFNAGIIYGWIGIPEISLEMALEHLRKSLRIGEEFGFKEVIAKSLVRSADMYHALGKVSQAVEYYQKSLKMSEEMGDSEIAFVAANNLGNIYIEKSNFIKAMELLSKGLKISERKLDSGADWWRLSIALINIGIAFGSQGNLEQTLAYGQKAVEAAEEGIMLGDLRARAAKVTALTIVGESHLFIGNHSLAMGYFQKGLKAAEELGEGLGGAWNREDIITNLKEDIGHTFAAQKNTPQAITSYGEALKLAEKRGNKDAMASALSGLSKIYLSQGSYREAKAFAERAATAAEQGRPQILRSALTILAQTYCGLGQPEAARQALARAIDITERLQEQTAGGELDRQRSFQSAVTPYQVMIDLEADQKRFAEAFSYAQRAKGRTLLELLQQGRINVAKSASPVEREKEQRLNRKIVSLNRQITGEKLKSQPDVKRMAEFEEQLKKARLEFEAFQTRLYAAHHELKVERGEIQPISLDDAVDLIPDTKTALLDFIVTDENVHLFVLTKDPSAQPILNTYTIKIERKALAEKVERYRGRMENRDYDFQALSQELYLLLLKPAQKQLQNKTNLIISPDNVLWDLPFQTVLSPELRYLIEDAAISYAPSLSVVREVQLASKKRHAPAKASLLALGNPALGTRSKELAKFAKMDANLQPLPEAAAQARALGRLYGTTLSRVYTGPAAREELVKEQSAQYRILHLATHGILNDVSPMYSNVMLSQTPGKNDEDGLLEAWEMMNLDLNADLVVLAACETARGRAGAGEGVIGMSWALFVAGCPRTVVSQWKVEASSTTALMVEFHKRFKTRYGGAKPAVSTAEAMRQAALKVMRNPEYVHPFYWGGFVVVGDGN